MTDHLAEPFANIFVDRAEADWAFDLLREAIRRLRVPDRYDPRLAITLSRQAGRHFLHLNFGGWLVLGFRGPGQSAERVDMTLLAELVTWDERLNSLPFERKEGEPEVRSYGMPVDMLQPMPSHLQQAFVTTLDFIADKFTTWKKATRWKHHNPELIEACFDPDKRAQLFAAGLNDLELRYERAFTAFGLTVAEEEELYDADDEETRGGEEAKRRGDEEIRENAGEFDDFQSPIAPSPLLPLSQIAEETGFDEAELERWVRAIERKGQAIFFGPPGTGKTFIAQKLAAHLIGGGDGFVEMVQFHPAYAYEDFVQGIRPAVVEGQLSYKLKTGRFLDFCQRATGRDTCVLIIDEINRANLSRVLGELMVLLEYRNQEIPLAGGGSLRIPANVRLIGTMNTADRSIALVDHALRRRFAFIRLQPNYEALRRYHQREQTGFPVEALIAALTSLNKHIDDPHYHVGITFFMHPNLAADLPDIWQMEIEPYLEEYFFNQRDKLADFEWAVIKAEFKL